MAGPLLISELGCAVDWRRIVKGDYLQAIERSPVWDLEIKSLLKGALAERTQDHTVHMNGLDASYAYEGYEAYRTADPD